MSNNEKPYRDCSDKVFAHFKSRFEETDMDLAHVWPEDEWMVEGLFMTGGKVNFITGQAKSGKTRFMIWMLTHMFEGVAVFNQWRTKQPERVIWLLGEEPQRDVERRIRRYAEMQGFDWKTWSTCITFIPAIGLGMERETIQAALERLIREERADLIVGDPFRRLHDAAESSNDDIKGVNTFMRAVANKYMIDWWFVHHTGKIYDASLWELANINFWFRGATDVPSIVDGACFLWRTDGKEGSAAKIDLYRSGRAGEWKKELLDMGMTDVRRPIETDRGWRLA